MKEKGNNKPFLEQKKKKSIKAYLKYAKILQGIQPEITTELQF